MKLSMETKYVFEQPSAVNCIKTCDIWGLFNNNNSKQMRDDSRFVIGDES